MRTKAIYLTLLLLALCQIAPRVLADNPGDWTPTNHAQWWWKYVFPTGKAPNWLRSVSVTQVTVGRDEVNERTSAITNVVTVRLHNDSRDRVTCDGSVRMLHTIRAADGSVRYQENLGTFKIGVAEPGATFYLRGVAHTPARLRGLDHLLEIEVQ